MLLIKNHGNKMTNEADEQERNLLPMGPPPLLTQEQIHHLRYTGWLALDLPPHLATPLQALSQSAAHFFDEPRDVKTKRYPHRKGVLNSFQIVPEEKEFITLRHANGDPDFELETHASQVWAEAGKLLHRVLCDIGRAAGVRDDAWNHLVAQSLSLPEDRSRIGPGDVTSQLRLFCYYPDSGTAEQHVDVGLLTLCVGDGAGLQMLDRPQLPAHWVDAQGPIILVGEMLRKLLPGRVNAGPHRVIGNANGRASTVFALRPFLGQSTDLATFGGEGVVDTKAMFNGVRDSKFDVNAKRDERERQREALVARHRGDQVGDVDEDARNDSAGAEDLP